MAESLAIRYSNIARDDQIPLAYFGDALSELLLAHDNDASEPSHETNSKQLVITRTVDDESSTRVVIINSDPHRNYPVHIIGAHGDSQVTGTIRERSDTTLDQID